MEFHKNPYEGVDIKNLILAVVLCAIMLVVWHYAYNLPRQQALQVQLAKEQEQQALKAKQQQQRGDVLLPQVDGSVLPNAAPAGPAKSRVEIIASQPRLHIVSPSLHGTISLIGGRIDDLTLARYHEEVNPASPEVKLLNPSEIKTAYFAEVGWISPGGTVPTPGKNTPWQADQEKLTPQTPVTLSWNNGQGVEFRIIISLDERYLFTIQQKIINHTDHSVELLPYALLNRVYEDMGNHYVILHEGPLGVLEGTLSEITYQKLREEGPQQIEKAKGWLGFTDKYWLAALVPSGDNFRAKFSHYQGLTAEDRYQADALMPVQNVAPGAEAQSEVRLFAGAKELNILDDYSVHYGIPLFDRAVDFGSLYFLTRPIFLLLNYFYSIIGNFGISILLLTVFIKLLMFPLANKSYVAMGAMKRLQPEMTKLRERHGEDKVRMNQELMALYKREKVNPMAGCLPLLVQIPVFFALYKVLFVTIEMRHAPFYGWINDLSAPDPTNMFNLFGLLHWNPPLMLHIGAWPLAMCITMIIQQRMNPPLPDKTQRRMMAALPYIFLFMFSGFPAGLVVYWTWNNILSILQQWFITRRHKPKNAPAK